MSIMTAGRQKKLQINKPRMRASGLPGRDLLKISLLVGYFAA